ncbi:MAG: lactonase family protein [Maribacter sp.]
MKRGYKVQFVTVVSIVVLAIIQSCNMKAEHSEETLFVGTYTDSGSEGIYRFSFNPLTGELQYRALAAALKNPSFIAMSEDRKNMYAVGEVDDFEGTSGSITTFKLTDTILEKLDTQSTHGANPCHVSVSKTGDYVGVANYTGGNVAVFKRSDTGRLEANPQVIDHKVSDSSSTSHAHMAKFIDGELFVADLGLDRIKKYNEKNNRFGASEQPELVVAEGAGPRHFVTSKDARFVYVINELNSTITLFEKQNERYAGLQTYTTLAVDFKGESYCADIRLSSDGKFLYGSNRGENTIVIFKVDAANGHLELVGRESVRGDWPRNFTLDPSGGFLLVANQRSNNIVVFKRDTQTGVLGFVGEMALQSPVCLDFL